MKEEIAVFLGVVLCTIFSCFIRVCNKHFSIATLTTFEIIRRFYLYRDGSRTTQYIPQILHWTWYQPMSTSPIKFYLNQYRAFLTRSTASVLYKLILNREYCTREEMCITKKNKFFYEMYYLQKNPKHFSSPTMSLQKTYKS